jgi:glycosyltransferase involved in cell wall biosynthesis
MENTQPSLALVAIAGNCESYVRRFIESFQRLTPHIYIVRACGSRDPDKTLDIAREMGCKVGEYKNAEAHQFWDHVDNFGAARQMAADMAEADGHEWLMWADTDDILEPESADIIREHLRITAPETTLALVPYRLTNNGLNLLRERIWRRGTAVWADPVHEHLEPVDKSGVGHVRWEDCRIVHAPDSHKDEADGKQGNQRNWRIISSIPDFNKTPRWLFYASLEHFGFKDDENGMAYAIEALKHDGLDNNERYELYLQLAMRTPTFAPKKSLLHEAYKVSPWRREALAQLAAVSLDNDQPQDALAYARSFMAIPVPEIVPWTHRPVVYGFGGVGLYACCLRANGDAEKADKFELEWFKKCGGKISVCHPTRGRPLQAAETRKKWLEAAKDPQAIEYIFGFSADDTETADILGRFRHAQSAAGNLDAVGGTLVQNYNAAVRASSGKIILTIQDDLEPCLFWDELIWKALENHLNRPAVLQVGDGYRNDDLLITFCVTRPTLRAMNHNGGIVSDEYRGVFCDNEFTHRAKKNGWIVPSDIVLRHEHPFFNPAVPTDDIYAIENSSEGYKFGLEVFRRRNPDAFDSQG